MVSQASERRCLIWKRAAKRVMFGSRAGIAGTVYGTIVVMAALTAGSEGDLGPWRLAAIVVTTVLVIWIAHVYAHGLSESIELGRRLQAAELAGIAKRELSIPLAAVGPIAALVLGGLGLIREATAVWAALGIGLATLALQGMRYARVEHLGRIGTAAAIAVNVALGLVIVGLKAGLAH